MEIGIGLPTTIPGVEGRQLVEWSRRAERAGFSTLGTIDRVVYPNYEPLIGLAAAAVVTERIRLTTAILILPLRLNATLVAKQAATIQHLSDGRLVLGLAVGVRPDDFEAGGVPFEGRGKRFEEMLEDMQRIWAGEERGYAGAIGPDVSENPPSVIIGGQVDAAFRRAASYGDGWIMGAQPPDALADARPKLEAAFQDAGRDDRPRALALTYFSLDDDPEEQTRRTIGHYYSFIPEYAEVAVADTAKGEDAVKERVRAFEEAGCDELIAFPASSDPEQVDRLAAAVL
ncbi:MAG: LLM class flavin-dependent oxidoreductase [Thermoleophilaceae bacterium]|nr:LLM class flavin-dependent oxidoreductase [Thermoleophilaceae bacterium]